MTRAEMRRRSLSELLDERARHVEVIGRIDVELATRGVRAIRAPGPEPKVRGRILAVLEARPGLTAGQIAESTGQSKHAASQMCHLLVREGVLRRAGRGRYLVAAAPPGVG